MDNPQAPTHIFPIIECLREKNTLVLQTTLRKKHRGKYYYWQFVRNAYVPEGKNDYTSAISSFNRDIYLAQFYGKIDPKLKYKETGEPVYVLCENQIDEKDRMNPSRRLGGVEQTINNKK